MEIVGDIKTYDWGKLGTDSVVAQLAKLNSENVSINASTPYSELWMGAHPSGPSTVKDSGKELGSVLSQDLPFLFKVLSVRKALSIQVHPNKAEAARLHGERPDVYKDPNHKPELAIALTPFTALVGFRPYEEIYKFCELLPPLRRLLGGDVNVEQLKIGNSSNLRKCYKRLMTSNQRDVELCIEEICNKHTEVLAQFGLLDTFNTINRDFPQDVGVLSLFFLNLMQLKPGQAIFLGANEIHAYLYGDCIECMACSDNVIRAGLTPKYKDVDQLILLLNYEGLPGESKLFQHRDIDSYAKLFAPPVDDFAVIELHLPSGVEDYKLQVKPVGSILLVLQGERTLRIQRHDDLLLKRGSIVYIPPEAAPHIQFLLKNEGTDDFIAYLATANTFQRSLFEDF